VVVTSYMKKPATVADGWLLRCRGFGYAPTAMKRTVVADMSVVDGTWMNALVAAV